MPVLEPLAHERARGRAEAADPAHRRVAGGRILVDDEGHATADLDLGGDHPATGIEPDRPSVALGDEHDGVEHGAPRRHVGSLPTQPRDRVADVEQRPELEDPEGDREKDGEREGQLDEALTAFRPPVGP